MTLVALDSRSVAAAHSPSVPVIVLGTDAVLAAMPATPVQLAHACMRAGYANVIPVSWGDELVAMAAMRRLRAMSTGPAVQCSCPIVAHRLLHVGDDLRPMLLPLVAPPVAVARYLRALSRPMRPRITYVGACPGAIDDAIDIRMLPAAFLEMLGERGIAIDDQPRVFESVIPPDRRRYRSEPGGLPSSDMLWTDVGARTVVELAAEDFVAELAQHLLGGKDVLIDASACLGCACSGAIAGAPARDARDRVAAAEPPRATAPIVQEDVPIQLEISLPAAARSPIDVIAPIHRGEFSHLTAERDDAQPPHRSEPGREIPSPAEPRSTRPANPSAQRSLVRGSPHESKGLPRTYIVRRRSSPKGLPVVTTPTEAPRPAMLASTSRDLAPTQTQPRADPPALHETHEQRRWSLDTPLAMRHAVLLAAALVLTALIASALLGVIIGRAFSTPH